MCALGGLKIGRYADGSPPLRRQLVSITIMVSNIVVHLGVVDLAYRVILTLTRLMLVRSKQ